MTKSSHEQNSRIEQQTNEVLDNLDLGRLTVPIKSNKITTQKIVKKLYIKADKKY